MPDIFRLRELSELREQGMQVAAQFHATLLVRFEDYAYLIHDGGLALEQRFDQFLRDLILTDNSIHVSPDEIKATDSTHDPKVTTEACALARLQDGGFW